MKLRQPKMRRLFHQVIRRQVTQNGSKFRCQKRRRLGRPTAAPLQLTNGATTTRARSAVASCCVLLTKAKSPSADRPPSPKTMAYSISAKMAVVFIPWVVHQLPSLEYKQKDISLAATALSVLSPRISLCFVIAPGKWTESSPYCTALSSRNYRQRT